MTRIKIKFPTLTEEYINKYENIFLVFNKVSLIL